MDGDGMSECHSDEMDIEKCHIICDRMDNDHAGIKFRRNGRRWDVGMTFRRNGHRGQDIEQ